MVEDGCSQFNFTVCAKQHHTVIRLFPQSRRSVHKVFSQRLRNLCVVHYLLLNCGNYKLSDVREPLFFYWMENFLLFTAVGQLFSINFNHLFVVLENE